MIACQDQNVLDQSGKYLNESEVRKLRPQYTIRQNVVQLAANSPLRTQVLSVPKNVPPHDHDYYEICLVTGGEAMHRTEDDRTRITRGTLIVVPPGAVHAFERVRQFRVINIYYLSEWLLADLRRLWDEPGFVPLFLAQSLFRFPRQRIPQFRLDRAEMLRVMRELDDIIDETNSGQSSMVYLRATFVKLLVRLSRAFARQNHEALALPFRPAIWKALSIIERAVVESEPFSVNSLSRNLGASPDHVARLFKSATGFAPMKYFQQRRVQHAGLLLLNPDARITEIAYELGYSDAAHLSRMFRQYRGISPREYRQMYVRKS